MAKRRGNSKSKKSTEFDYITEESEIFTDIDSYEGTYVENDSTKTNDENYGAWGENNDDVTINIYSGFGHNYYSPYSRGRYGWNNRWSWNYGYTGFYDPFWCPPYYGYGYSYNYYGYGGYYGNYGYSNYGSYYGNIYSRRGIAYNSGRRGRVYANRNGLTRRNALNISRGRSQTRSNSTGRTRIFRKRESRFSDFK